MKYAVIKILSLFFLLVLISCSSSPKFTSKNDSPPSKDDAANKAADKTENKSISNLDTRNTTILETTTGIASYYAHEFHGKQTSSGEIYDMYGVSAAHPSYPEGTIVRVTNLENNISTILRINDHMPEHPERIIDLSYGAAEKLEMIESGLANVRIEVIEWGKK